MLTYEEFICSIRDGLVTAEAAHIPGYSRQNIDDLVRRGKLVPFMYMAFFRDFMSVKNF